MTPNSLAIRNRSHLYLLGLIIAFAAALRIYNLSTLGFWTDEFCSLSDANGWGMKLYSGVQLNRIASPLPVCTRLANARLFHCIPSTMATDETHPPLYFMLLRGWEKMFGDTEAGVRSLNVVLSLAAILLLFFAARDSVGSTTALTACLLMAVATPQIQFAQEARNYMLGVVLLLLAALAVRRIARRPTIAWAGLLCVSFLAAIFTHYFTCGAGAGLAAWALLSSRARARRWVIGSSVFAGCIFLVLWGRSLLLQRSNIESGQSWLTDQAAGHIWRRLLDLCRLSVRFFAEFTDPRAQLSISMIGAIALVSLVVLFIQRRELRMWIAWMFAAIALVAFADFARSTTQLNWVRYTLFATPAAYVLLAAAIPRGRWRMLLPGTAIVASILTLPNAYIPAWKKDYRTPIEIVCHRLSPGDGLVILGKNPIDDGIMLAAFQHYAQSMPAPVAVLTRSPDTATLQRLRQCPHLCVVRMWPGIVEPIPGFGISSSADESVVPGLAEFSFGKICD